MFNSDVTIWLKLQVTVPNNYKSFLSNLLNIYQIYYPLSNLLNIAIHPFIFKLFNNIYICAL